jgi:hypothetical protein
VEGIYQFFLYSIIATFTPNQNPFVTFVTQFPRPSSFSSQNPPLTLSPLSQQPSKLSTVSSLSPFSAILLTPPIFYTSTLFLIHRPLLIFIPLCVLQRTPIKLHLLEPPVGITILRATALSLSHSLLCSQPHPLPKKSQTPRPFATETTAPDLSTLSISTHEDFSSSRECYHSFLNYCCILEVSMTSFFFSSESLSL